MGSDYERWKKRREGERLRRERDVAQPPRPTAPPPASGTRPAPRESGPPRRSYQGYIPPAPAPGAAPPVRRRGGGRGCTGCLALLVGGVLLVGLGLLLAGLFYWQQVEQRGRVNVLMLGIDERPNEGLDFRSDTMILAGFNPAQREVALLSIPRDLYVTVPDYGENRINTAHFFGGPPLAMETVRRQFNIPLHYYVRMNFNGFVSIVDAMGGITVDVAEPLHDENYPTPDYGITTIDIPAGVQQMDGATALIYARSRYSTSDFDRSRRQQQIIAAIRDKLAQPRVWLRAPAIFGAALTAIATDIPQEEWPALALILIRSSVERAAIGPEAVEEIITAEGAQVLEPNWEAINTLTARYFR